MSDENKVIPAGTPIIINTVPTTPASAEPVQLREGRERREAELAEAHAKGANEVLKGLGVKKSERARMIEEIRAGRVRLAEARDAAVAANQVAAQVDSDSAAIAAAQGAAKAEAEALRASLKKYADQEFAALPETFQKTINEMKLDDPQKRLEMIDVFKRTGLLSAAAGAATTATEAKPADAKPAAPASVVKPVQPSTTLAQPPAATSPPGATLNYYETWKSMTDRGEHWLAAQYLQAHQVKILEQRPQNR